MPSKNGHEPDANAVLREKVRELLEERNALTQRVMELESALTPFAELWIELWESSQNCEIEGTVPISRKLIANAARSLAGTMQAYRQLKAG